jgi:hypothetical protein
MPPKPRRSAGYPPDAAVRIRQACLRVADVLGDLMSEVVVIGGMVPQLLIESQESVPEQAYIGTLDLDLGLSLAVQDRGGHEPIAARLRERGYGPDRNERGNPSLQRWRIGPESGEPVLVDFMTPLAASAGEAGKVLTLESDFGAVQVPGLGLAFRDNLRVALSRQGAEEGAPKRRITVCGHGAFIVLKALAHRVRNEHKDAYDIYYVLRHLPRGSEETEARIRPLLEDPHTVEALRLLAEDFAGPEAIGSVRVAEFLRDGNDEVIQADASGYVRTLLERLRGGGPAA